MVRQRSWSRHLIGSQQKQSGAPHWGAPRRDNAWLKLICVLARGRHYRRGRQAQAHTLTHAHSHTLPHTHTHSHTHSRAAGALCVALGKRQNAVWHCSRQSDKSGTKQAASVCVRMCVCVRVHMRVCVCKGALKNAKNPAAKMLS